MSSTIEFDAIDQDLVAAISPVRDKIQGPRLGDFVRFPTGEMLRLSFEHESGGGMQAARSGAFFLFKSGSASFAGGHDQFAIPMESLSLSSDVQDGEFWFFHHGEVGPRIDFNLACRVYDTTKAFKGGKPASEY